MPNFLLIETGTQKCSTAISCDDRIVAYRETDIPKAHASMLAPFIKEVLEESSLSIQDLSAVAVGEGPGSYTGLRVGVSTAKGICFGVDIPLIGVGTLNILSEMAIADGVREGSLIIPMIDARRMEVYTALYDSSGHQLSDISAKVLDSNSFSDEFQHYSSIVFIGDGVEKLQHILPSEALDKSTFISCCPSAKGMVRPTTDRWNKKEFKDRAYFEPFYLKEFVAGISKKKLI